MRSNKYIRSKGRNNHSSVQKTSCKLEALKKDYNKGLLKLGLVYWDDTNSFRYYKMLTIKKIFCIFSS